MYIDVHCHLTGGEYEEIGGVKGVLARAEENGVKRVICSGYDLLSSMQAQTLAHEYEQVYFCAGFHPSELDKYQSGDLEKIEKLCQDEKCVAVGEIGLDYHFEDNPERDFQKRLFIEQLVLADKVGLPVVIHSRDASQDTLEILKENKALLKKGGLMHCYSYSPESSDDFSSLGLCFSFGGPCTFKNAKKVQNSIQRIPAPLLLSETDCPYLTPTPFRGVFPNEPKNVRFVVEQMALLKGVSVEEMQEQIFNNAKKLFFKLK